MKTIITKIVRNPIRGQRQDWQELIVHFDSHGYPNKYQIRESGCLTTLTAEGYAKHWAMAQKLVFEGKSKIDITYGMRMK